MSVCRANTPRPLALAGSGGWNKIGAEGTKGLVQAHLARVCAACPLAFGRKCQHHLYTHFIKHT